MTIKKAYALCEERVMICDGQTAAVSQKVRNTTDSDVARCPICRHELVPQMTATGPGFPCYCRPK